MALKYFSTSILTLFFIFQLHPITSQNVIKSVYWFPDSGIAASEINSALFTHLFCAFADLDPNTNQVVIASAKQSAFSSFTSTVQRKNPSAKTLLSIGGGSANPVFFATMATQQNSRKAFIDSSIRLARSNGFHGLDLDWEYPSNPTQMANFGTLITEWRTAIGAESRASGKPALLLSAAVFYSSNYYTANYPLEAVKNSFDWINIMAYDFYGPGWSQVTGPPAALFNPGKSVSGDIGIRAWIQAGMPPSKIVLGFPYYGWAWRLTDPNNHGLFAPTSGAALSSDGAIGYKQILQFITQNGATKVFDSTVVTDYCYSGTTWIGFDDTQSISAKIAYAKGKGLRGYFAWHAANDNNWVLSTTASRAWGS